MARSKTVQGYLDETPNWADGTPVASAPMAAMQWRRWLLADLGTNLLPCMLIGTSLLGAVITHVFAIEVKGRNLEELEAGLSEPFVEVAPASVPGEPSLSPAT